MKAFRFYEPGKIKLEEIDTPKIGLEEILVEIKATLTCGTDVKMYKRGHPKVKSPMTLGHEFGGIIADVGDKVPPQFKVGQRVTAANSAPCNNCFFCKIG